MSSAEDAADAMAILTGCLVVGAFVLIQFLVLLGIFLILFGFMDSPF